MEKFNMVMQINAEKPESLNLYIKSLKRYSQDNIYLHKANFEKGQDNNKTFCNVYLKTEDIIDCWNNLKYVIKDIEKQYKQSNSDCPNTIVMARADNSGQDLFNIYNRFCKNK